MTSRDSDSVEIPIDGVLDLHTFAPRDVASVVDEYLWACMQKGLLDVRIIHGKGYSAVRCMHAFKNTRMWFNTNWMTVPRDGGSPLFGSNHYSPKRVHKGLMCAP